MRTQLKWNSDRCFGLRTITQYVISTDEFDMSRDGIKHMNILDFLLGDEI